jgi:hypothetical protein
MNAATDIQQQGNEPEVQTSAEVVITDAVNFEAEPVKEGRVNRVNIIDALRGFDHYLGSTPVGWIHPGILRECTSTLIVGMSGAAKSTFSWAFGNAMANGLEFLGYQHTPRKVVILDNDGNSLGDLIDRFEDLHIEVVDGGNLKYFGQFCDDEVPMPDFKDVKDYAESNPGTVFILDSLCRFLNDGNENDTQVIAKLHDRCAALKARNCAVILLHHTTKGDPEQYRGSTAVAIRRLSSRNWARKENQSSTGRVTKSCQSLSCIASRHAAPERRSMSRLANGIRSSTSTSRRVHSLSKERPWQSRTRQRSCAASFKRIPASTLLPF